MSTYVKIKIVFVLILAIGVSVFTYIFLKNRADEINIVVASQDIEARTKIKPDMLKTISIRKKDKDLLTPNAVTGKKVLENAISLKEIQKGKPIDKTQDVISGTKEYLLNKKVIHENGEINDSYFLSNNKRIAAIRLDSQGSVNFKVKKGDFVDVIYTNSGDKGYTATIMQHIEVYDVTSVNADGASDNVNQNISLLVTQQQAVDITFAKRQGKIDLALNPSNGDNELVVPATSEKLSGDSNADN